MKYVAITMITLLALVSTAAHSGIGIPGVGKDTSASAGSAVAMQDDLVLQFQSAWASIAESQAILAEGLGSKDEAAAHRANAEMLSSGSVMTKDELEKVVMEMSSASEEIETLMATAEELSEEARAAWVASIPPYLTGLSQAQALVPQLKDFATAAKDEISSANMMNKRKVQKELAPGMYLAQHAPGLVGDSVETGTQLIAFAQSHDIPLPKDATDALDFASI